MFEANKIAKQIALAQELENFLSFFISRLAAEKFTYIRKCHSLRDAGMFKEPLEAFENECMSDTVHQIEVLMGKIENKDLPEIKKYRQKWEALLIYLTKHTGRDVPERER